MNNNDQKMISRWLGLDFNFNIISFAWIVLHFWYSIVIIVQLLLLLLLSFLSDRMTHEIDTTDKYTQISIYS